MKVTLWMSSMGGSPLQVALERGLQRIGHEVEYYQQGQSCDVLLMFNQSCHDTSYRYPDFPTHFNRLAFIDTAEYGYFKRFPNVIGQYANTFSEGALNHDTKVRSEQEKLKAFLDGRSFPYFIREFSKYIEFPANYHPIDYPLYHLSGNVIPPRREEYLRRALDLFVCWGASHPWRLNITDALRNYQCRSEIHVIDQQRMKQDRYFKRTNDAKCSVSFDGYGSGSFRITEVLIRCLLLQGPMTIHVREPLTHGVNCIEYQIESDGETFISTNICEKLKEALADPERSFEIYKNGYQHCMKHYSEKAVAAYVMQVIEQHNWQIPTQLDICKNDES